MTEFINEFGKTNFIVLLSIILVVVIALIIILIIENKANKKEYEYIEDLNQKEEQIKPSEDDKVVYVDHEPTKEEAKEKLEAVTRKLIEDDLNIVKHPKKEEIVNNSYNYNNDLIEHTDFEKNQEEDSIISYDELIKSSQNIDEVNDKLLKDEEEQAITIEELYKKHEDKQNIVLKEEKVNNPIFEEEKKFKNSDVISPVFGVYTGEIKNTNVLKEINKNIKPEDIEEEINKTEEFLEELKRLKSKLN